MVAIAAGSYFAGSQASPTAAVPPAAVTKTKTAGFIAPKVLATSPEPLPEISNPTGVLLGEVKVPVELLKGPPPSPAPGVIIPEIVK